MQFSVPFIKTLIPPSTGNLLEIPQDETTYETMENAVVCEDDIHLTNSSYNSTTYQLQPPPPPPTSPPLPAPFLSPSASPVLSQQSNCPSKQLPSSRIKKNLKVKNKSAIEADTCVAEYFKAKKARLEANLSTVTTNSYNSERKEALKMFLLSLMPEVEHFNNDQIKIFKRKVFSVIDDISSLHASTLSSLFTTSLPSTHTSEVSVSSNALDYYTNFSGTFENYNNNDESDFRPL